MKKTAYLLILLGLLIILMPFGTRVYDDWKQQKIIDAWEKNMEQIASIDEIEARMQADDALTEVAVEIEEESEALKKNIIPMIQIDKIDVKLPILEGATKENLAVAVTHMENTPGLGEGGNYSLAGHRSYTYGRFFNRLDEVGIGDEIDIIWGEEEYVYTVYEKIIVNPEEVWVLNDIEDKTTVTLITCHPIRVASHRLIVRGELNEVEN